VHRFPARVAKPFNALRAAFRRRPRRRCFRIVASLALDLVLSASHLKSFGLPHALTDTLKEFRRGFAKKVIGITRTELEQKPMPSLQLRPELG